MLRSLYVRDYALIEELHVEFGEGLNVITGETGAGKSILIGALQLILGGRASMDRVRAGASKAIVEGMFDHADDAPATSVLERHAIDLQPVLILRREVSPSFSRGFINDTPATLPVMREVASHLVDLHGQHGHQSLLDISTHLDLLDGFAGLTDLRGRVARSFREVRRIVAEYQGLLSRKREFEQQRELYAFQIQEIDRLEPKAGEGEALEEERRVLENAEQLYDASVRLNAMLYEGGSSVHDRLAEVRDALRRLVSIDARFEETLREIEAAGIIVSEAAAFLQHYATQVDSDPGRLEAIRSRMAELQRLARKYGGSVEALLEHRRTIGEGYESVQDFEGTLERLAERVDEARKELSGVAVALSNRRREAAGRIEAAVREECSHLGMPHCQFAVACTMDEDPKGWVDVPGSSGGEVAGPGSDAATAVPGASKVVAHASGIDRVEFHVSTNPGEEPRPLARVASGGEISRIMLALKTVLARSERFPVLVFDEIDVGISGQMASKVGRCMHALASSHQIIAITHLPQIAALGDAHFLVEKQVEGGRTQTSIRRLSESSRAAHVAGLMRGTEVTEAALESARELMRARHKRKK